MPSPHKEDDPVDLYYGKANALLRRAALSTLLGGAFGVLLLGGLVIFAMQKAGPGRLGWAFWPAVGGLAAVLIAWCWSTYRQLARVRVTEAGLELAEGTGSTLVPWHTLEEIEIKSRELRIRATGQRLHHQLPGAVEHPAAHGHHLSQKASGRAAGRREPLRR